MTDFARVKRVLEQLLALAGCGTPSIRREKPEDPCDFTSPKEIRLNCPKADCTDEWHARHVFGHWLCRVHEEADARRGGAKSCDRVANAIARFTLTVLPPEETL